MSPRHRCAALAAGALTFSLAACGATAAADDSTQDTTSTAAESTAAGTAPSSDASGTASTQLSSGTATVTIGDKEITYQAAYLVDGIDAVIDGGTYDAATSDEVVFLVVNGGSLTITGATVTKEGDAGANDSSRTSDVSDEYNFYGMNSGVVVVGEGSSATIDGSTITTTSSGSNAVIAVDGATANVTSTTITTSGNSARGLHATYGATIAGADLTITTAGAHSAAVATDRGGGTVTVTGANRFDTSGDGSPLLYSTGTISVDGLTGTASGSQVIVIEGKNSATLTNSDVTSSGGDAVMIYQSMSGDAADSDAASSVGAVTIENTTIAYDGDGPVFYFTNTDAALALTDVTVDSAATTLGSAQEDRWGTSGSNGADVVWTISGSTLSGSVEAGSSSSIDVTLTGGATLSGTTSGDVSVTNG